MTDSGPFKCFHIPGYAGEVTVLKIAGQDLLFPKLTLGDVRRAVERVMTRGAEVLKTYSVDDLARIFEEAARTWLRPSLRRRALTLAMAELTGLSREVTEASVAVEQGNCVAADILAALDRDLGDRKALDGFVHDPRLGNLTKATGHPLVGAILSSNVPGLSYLPIVRALMVKTPLVAKLSSREPLFGPAWMETVAAIAPDLAECTALFCWQGGSAPGLEEAMLENAPAMMVYGGPDTERHFRKTYGETKQILVHGHKIGVALAGRDVLDSEEAARDLAEKLALDVAMYGQQACISPQVLYVERGGAVATEAFAAMVADALARLEASLPQGGLSLDAAAALSQERRLTQFEAGRDPSIRVFVRGGATVVHHGGPGFDSSLPLRFLRVYPLEDLRQAPPLLAPHGRYLQNVGLAVGRERTMELSEALARSGVSRISGIGSMHKPSMRWKHDGMGPYASMVRWTDMEMINQEEL